MVLDISAWMNDFLKALEETFGKRVWFVGLQGSYGRGEATETSDIDLVVILDELTAADIPTYNAMLDTLPHRELICGFLSGKEEILHWDAADLFQFSHDTTPIRGTLDSLLPLIDDAAVQRAIHMGACNIFHGCVHNMLYEKSEDILRSVALKDCRFVAARSHSGDRDLFDKHIYDDTVWMDFEFMKVPAPKGYHEYLVEQYGEEYMTPKHVAANHGTLIIDTSRSYKEVLPEVRKAFKHSLFKRLWEKISK